MTANLLANGDFRQGLDAWSTGAPSDQTEAGVDLSPRWSLPGTPTAYLHAKSPGATAEISQEFALGAPAAQVQRVVLSGSVGTHRATGELIITALAKDGRVLGTFTHFLPHRPSKPGGDKPESYDAFSCECPTPPGTARLRLLIRTGAHSGAKDPSRFIFLHSLAVRHGAATSSPASCPRDVDSEYQGALLLHLHETQEQLETYFLENRSLRKDLDRLAQERSLVRPTTSMMQVLLAILRRTVPSPTKNEPVDEAASSAR
jgi:hypothetical protein